MANRYPVQLSSDARTALQRILTPVGFNNLVGESNYDIVHEGVNILNSDLAHLFSNRKHENEQPQWANMNVLREVLSEGLKITWCKRVVRVREVQQKVEVVFEDGSTELADFVIGADGMNSTIRSQLHPSLSPPHSLPYVFVQFKLATSPSKIPTAFQQDGMNLVLGNSSNSTQIIVFSGRPLPPLDPKTALKMSEEGPFAEPDDTVKAVQKQLDDPKSGFVLARMTIPTRLAEGWEDYNEGSWIDRILTILRHDGTNEAMIKMIEDDLVPATTHASLMFSDEAGKAVPFREGRIVLVGDAMHVVPPTSANGIAAAILDAQGISETLLTSSEFGGPGGPLQALLPQNHYASKTRSEAYLKESLHLLEVSNQSGIQGSLHRGMLRSMDWFKTL
ncbi:uncharacterized protein I303_107532 [Kwoniella dejecticola CBS 10117]